MVSAWVIWFRIYTLVDRAVRIFARSSYVEVRGGEAGATLSSALLV